MTGNRRSIRLPGYDYASCGAYFVTISVAEYDFVRTGEACLALDSINIFGHIENGKMALNDLGRIVEERWHALSDHHASIVQDEFVVMPNHVHFIIFLADYGGNTVGARQDVDDRARQASPVQTILKPGSLGAIVDSFKSSVARHINEHRGTPGAKVWHRNYYDRIIRSESELNRICEYIAANPANWERDENNPNAVKKEETSWWWG